MPDLVHIPGPVHVYPFTNAVPAEDHIFVSGIAAFGDTAADLVRATGASVFDILAEVGSDLSEVVYHRMVVAGRSYVDQVIDTIKGAD